MENQFELNGYEEIITTMVQGGKIVVDDRGNKYWFETEGGYFSGETDSGTVIEPRVFPEHANIDKGYMTMQEALKILVDGEPGEYEAWIDEYPLDSNCGRDKLVWIKRDNGNITCSQQVCIPDPIGMINSRKWLVYRND